MKSLTIGIFLLIAGAVIAIPTTTFNIVTLFGDILFIAGAALSATSKTFE